MSSQTLNANGLTFTASITGPTDGEVVVLLHGFPDDASTFDQLAATLSSGGFRCVVPTMRGYEPSSQPADGDYALMTLADDVVGWLDHLGVDQAHIVGHDWGAAAAYVLAAHHPERCATLTALAIPPVARIPAAVRRVPKQLVLSWYMTFFQLRGIAEWAVRARRWALLRWFWRGWSPGHTAPDSLETTFDQPGVLTSALAYYRQNATPPLLLGLRSNPAMEPRPIHCRSLILHGSDDGCMDPRLFEAAVHPADFPAGVDRECLEGVGHWLHLEAPAEVAARVARHLSHPSG